MHLPPRRGYLWYRSMYILSDYVGVITIQNRSWSSNLYKFVIQPLKYYLNYMVRGFCGLIIIVYRFIQYVSLLCHIAIFYNSPSILHACYIALYLAIVFPSFYHYCSRIIFSGYKICTNIFKFRASYFNNRRLY